MNVQEKYRCHKCERLSSTNYSAQTCCSADEVLVCGKCGKEFSKMWEQDEAKDCCVPSVIPTEYCLCGNPCGGEEIRDSMLCGSLIRCRACLVNIGLPSVEMVIGA